MRKEKKMEVITALFAVLALMGVLILFFWLGFERRSRKKEEKVFQAFINNLKPEEIIMQVIKHEKLRELLEQETIEKTNTLIVSSMEKIVQLILGSILSELKDHMNKFPSDKLAREVSEKIKDIIRPNQERSD